MTILTTPFQVLSSSDELVKQHKANFKFISNFKPSDDDESSWVYYTHKSVLLGANHHVASEFRYAINLASNQLRRWTIQEEREMANYKRKLERKVSSGTALAKKAKALVSDSLNSLNRATQKVASSNQLQLF
ncbi:hypothetical protein [Acinetobacter sp. P1(2025)]|uniref:hypothetical protein n=1 Tax=Acinetobacter sp. P1(2025) TaxID=3446120 RepID=UPI003F53783E